MKKRRTIAESVEFTGKALQTGKKVRMLLKPASLGAGVVFERTDLEGSPFIRLGGEMLSPNADRRSTLALGTVQVQTVEHFLASLWALGIDDLLVELDSVELPGVDGSARGFLEPLKDAGICEFDVPQDVIKISEKIRIEEADRYLEISPADELTVKYHIDYNVPSIGSEDFEIVLDADSFEKEIAPARTFCMKKEALVLFLSGMGRGATFENTLVMGRRGPVGTTLHFPNEPVRHKVLDLVGDLYMLGRPVIGRIEANKSGHSLNTRLVKKIYETYVKD